MFECPYCDYITNKNYNLQRHCKLMHVVSIESEPIIIEPEPIIMEKKCSKCEKCFTTNWYMRLHEAKCKKTIDSLTCRYCNKQLTSNNSRNRHETICKNQIKAFNDENTDYITPEMAFNCLECGVSGLNIMIDNIYFNDNHPENKNVKIINIREKIIQIYTKDHKWQYDGFTNVIDTMINNAVRILLNKIDYNNSDNNILNMNAIMNLKFSDKKLIHQRIKNKLIEKFNLLKYLNAQSQ